MPRNSWHTKHIRQKVEVTFELSDQIYFSISAKWYWPQLPINSAQIRSQKGGQKSCRGSIPAEFWPRRTSRCTCQPARCPALHGSLGARPPEPAQQSGSTGTGWASRAELHQETACKRKSWREITWGKYGLYPRTLTEAEWQLNPVVSLCIFIILYFDLISEE